MKKIVTILSMLFISMAVFSQKYYTKTGQSDFKASVEAFEEVAAKNNSTSVLLDTESGNVAALLFIRAFHFKVALMEEHFNENYMDSDKFPKAIFKGKLQNFSFSKLTNKPQSFSYRGKLTIRGITKEVSTTAKVWKEGKQIKIQSHFTVKPEDFKIDIPGAVKDKIAKSIEITCNYALNKKG